MAAYKPGDRVFVEYDSGGGTGYGVFHERLVLGWLEGGLYAIATPDWDVYIEELAYSNDDLTAIRIGQDGQLPIGVSEEDCYCFRVLRANEEQSLMAEGARLIDQERQARGIGGPAAMLHPGPAAIPIGGAIAPVVPPAPAVGSASAAPLRRTVRIAPAAGMWILDEPAGKHEVGTEFTLPAGAQVLGQRALVNVDGEPIVLRHLAAGVDIDEYVEARLELLRIDPRLGPASKNLNMNTAQYVRELEELPLVGLNEIVSGPRSAPTFIKGVMRDQGATFATRHEKWKHNCGAKMGLPLFFEHETLSQVIDIAATEDRLNVLNLKCIELIVRRMQLHEHAVDENPEQPSYEGARHWMGLVERRGGAYIVPALQTHVAHEWGHEAAVMKEKRKAKEARDSMRNSRNQQNKNKDRDKDKPT